MPLVSAGPAIFLSPAAACGWRAPTQMRTVVVLRPQGIHQSTAWYEWCMTEMSKHNSKQAQTAANQGSVRLRVWSWLDEGSVWLVFQKVQRLIAFPAVSWVDCCVLQQYCVSWRPYSNCASLPPPSWFLHCRPCRSWRTLPLASQWCGDQFQNTSVQLHLRSRR